MTDPTRLRCKACGEEWPDYLTDLKPHQCKPYTAPAADAPAARDEQIARLTQERDGGRNWEAINGVCDEGQLSDALRERDSAEVTRDAYKDRAERAEAELARCREDLRMIECLDSLTFEAPCEDSPDPYVTAVSISGTHYWGATLNEALAAFKAQEWDDAARGPK